MLVRERMTRRPITVSEDTSVQAALQLMREEKVRRFPVVDKRGKRVGMVAEKDLLYASPSPATSLSIHEIAYLLSKVTVKQVMATDVVTINDDTPLEEAARILADNRVGAVPVMREGKLVGIITETDLFKIFLEMFGAREEGVRLTISVPEEPGMLARISSKIAQIGGNILALGTLLGEDPSSREIVIRASDVTQEQLAAAMQELDPRISVMDVRFCPLPTC
jgi:acetoin utilization protein AcuB